MKTAFVAIVAAFAGTGFAAPTVRTEQTASSVYGNR